MVTPLAPPIFVYLSGGPSDVREATVLATSLRALGVDVVSRWHERAEGDPRTVEDGRLLESADVLIVLERPLFSADVLADCVRAARETTFLVLYAPEGGGRGMEAAGFRLAKSKGALAGILRRMANELGALIGEDDVVPPSRERSVDHTSQPYAVGLRQTA